MSVNPGGTPKADYQAPVIDSTSTTTATSTTATSTDTTTTTNNNQSNSNNNPVPVVNGGSNNTVTAKKYLLGDVVINEFVSDPSDGEDEWVELYNNTNNDIDLSGWLIIEGSGKETVISGSVSPRGYFVVEKIKGSLNNDGDEIILHDANNDLVDRVTYGNWNDGQLKDNAPVVKDPKSVVRKVDGYSSFNNAFDFVKTNQPTKGAGNIVLNDELQIKLTTNLSTTTASSTMASSSLKLALNVSTTTAKATTTPKKNYSIKINEIMPSPDGSDTDGEWIEFYNEGAERINLLNWQVDDDDQGGSKPYKFTKDAWIESKGFFILKRTESDLALNNDGDKVIVADDNGFVIDKIVYEKSIAGQSYSRDDKGKWAFTMASTPGEKNQLIQKEAVKSNQKSSQSQKVSASAGAMDIPMMMSLEDARKLEKGAYILTEGVATVLPGVLGTQYFYIGANQKTESGVVNFGLQIYNFKKDFPALKIGDAVEVVGEISETNGERRLKTDSKKDIRVIGGNKTVTVQKLTCENIDDSLLGSLVTVEGEISDLKSTGMYLDDGTDEVQVYLKKTTGIIYKDYKEVNRVKVTGIVSSSKNGARLLPRSKNDIIILEKKTPVDTVKMSGVVPTVLGTSSENTDLVIEPRDGKKEAIKYAIIIAIGGGLLFLIWFFKFRK